MVDRLPVQRHLCLLSLHQTFQPVSSRRLVLDPCIFYTGILSFWYILPGYLPNELFTRYSYLD